MTEPRETELLPTTGHALQASEALQTADSIANALAASLAPREIGNGVFMVVPNQYRVEDLTEKRNSQNPTAPRKKGEAKLLDLASFITYTNEQSMQGHGYIYANTSQRSFTAVFNDYRHTEVAGWRDHRASYSACYSEEFKRWLENNGRSMGQTEFAEFIEDNMADIVPPFADTLLTVATTIQAKTDINFSSAKRLDNGQVQLGYTEIINTTAGADGALTIPREFEIGLRLFVNGEGYRLKARLKYRLHSGSVKFWYELDRPNRAVEDAFNGYVETLREQSNYIVLLGQP